MNRININDPQALWKAVEVLRGGGVVMHPTETCYGFAVDVFNENALKKLYALKGRDFNKPVSILVNGLSMAHKYGVFSDEAVMLAQEYWPGPLSLVIPRKRNLPEFLNPDEDFISIRHSSDSFSDDLVGEFGSPLTTTSANLSGEAPLYEADCAKFVGVDFVVDGGKILMNEPSTIVKVDGDLIEVLRQGSVYFS